MPCRAGGRTGRQCLECYVKENKMNVNIRGKVDTTALVLKRSDMCSEEGTENKLEVAAM